MDEISISALVSDISYLYTHKKKYKETIVYDDEIERIYKRKILRAERIAKLEKLDENNRKNK